MQLSREDLKDIKPNIVNVPHRKIMLCLNEGPVNPLDHLWDEISENLKKISVNRYHSDISDKLTQKLAEYANVSPESIIMGNGADEMLYYFFIMLRAKSSDKLVYPTPSYFDYYTYSKAIGLSQNPIDLKEDFSLETSSIIDALKDKESVAAIICNPNNPTGNLMDEAEIIEIIESTDKPVLIDEAYFEFSKKTFVPYIDKYENLFILRTFSKGFLSAGLRFGYLIASPNSIHEVKKVMTAFNLSLIIQSIALTYLENIDLFAKQIDILIKAREHVYKSLNKIELISPFKSATNFITFRVDGYKDSLFNYLKSQDIAIRDVSGHRLLKDCLRVTPGTSFENELFLKAVTEGIKAH